MKIDRLGKKFLITFLFATAFFALVDSWTYSFAEDFYIAQHQAGLSNGSNCANAHDVAWFNSSKNWSNPKQAGKIGPGDTVHLCGTFLGALNTTMLTVQGSGSPGSPITIKWEPGALLSCPAWSSKGALDCNGNDWLVINGNESTPSIINTANGILLANQQSSTGIMAFQCDHCEFKNLRIFNIYVVSGNADANDYGAGIIFSGSSYISIHDNFFDYMASPLVDAFDDGDTDISIYNNEFDHFNHAIEIGNNNFNFISNVYIHDNNFKNMNNWDTTGNYHHHDGIIFYQNTATSNTVQNFYIYNNLFNGDLGVCATAWIYCNSGINGVYIFNNVFLNPGAREVAMLEGGYSGDKNYHIYNNFIDCNKMGRAFQYSGIEGYFCENNVLKNCSVFQLLSNITGQVRIDYNAYINASLDDDSQFKWNGKYITLKALRALGHDIHTIVPANLAMDSFGKPRERSPLMGAGSNLSSLGIQMLNFDKEGNSRPVMEPYWDMGPYELSVSSPNLSMVKSH